MRRLSRRFAVCATALGTACLFLTAAASALPILHQHGRWLTDPQGRAVILHGMQIAHFEPPATVESVDMRPSNVRFLAAQGFNAARVSMTYAGFEPQPGLFDQSYLDGFIRFDQQLADARVYDLVDIMQGQFSPSLNGFGFADWMAQTDGLPNTGSPFPLGYLDNPAENRAWDHLWANSKASDGIGLQDHFATGMQRIAARLNGSPGLLGFDVFNEPWPGTPYPTCANPVGCPPGGFDQTSLTSFYRKVLPKVRAGAPRYPLFFEPNSLFDYGANTGLGNIGQQNAVFTFHNYCLGDIPGLPQLDPGQNCGIEEQLVLQEADAYAAAKGVGVLEDEWGNTASLPLLNRMGEEADASMMGWAYWSYEDYFAGPGAVLADATKPAVAEGNLRRPVLNALVRPYPQAIAGTPTRWGYARDTGTFHLSYSTHPVGSPAFKGSPRTRIELPALRYPTGYSVVATGGRVVSPPDANRLLVVANTGARTVSLRVTPATHHAAELSRSIPRDCPIRSQRLPIDPSGGAVVATKLVIDGVPFDRVRGPHIHSVPLPLGLAGGTILRVSERLASGAPRTERWRIQPCSPQALVD